MFLLQEPYINRSTPRIEEDLSLHRTYIIFRTLGLRHLTVVDMAGRPVGIITRKDLMGFNLEQRLNVRKRRGYSVAGPDALKLLPSEQGRNGEGGLVGQGGAQPEGQGGAQLAGHSPDVASFYKWLSSFYFRSFDSWTLPMEKIKDYHRCWVKYFWKVFWKYKMKYFLKVFWKY